MTGWLPDSWRLCGDPDTPSADRCGQCDKPIPKHSVSRYFCDDTCQSRWQRAQAAEVTWPTQVPDDLSQLSAKIRHRLGIPDPGPELGGVA